MTYRYYLIITIALATAAHAHSWIDTLVVATPSGNVYGHPRYIRNYNPAQCDTLYGVMEWGAQEGQRGEILAVAPFDDGICSEANETPISKGRGGLNIPCHSAFTIPWDVQSGSIYTVYWIWDYLDAKHIEIYTSCTDIDIIGKGPEGVL
ncbi:hypothetical protein C7212DRAFT_362861 [Tuber magnatum]|uniref:DUF7492 domain-containing protein n=1 Tax=Tuber magnatum TaxID=42249 RepID=A0A317SS91_9PEZI|nr:hypothetical protein C7212DRAFT_362861 [Tuber magnatum]